MSVAQPVIDYIDPDARKIYLLAGVAEYHPLDDIYKEIRYMRRTDEELRKYLMFVEAGGNIPKNASGTLRTPRYAIFKNCQVVVSGDTYVSGEQLYADENGDVTGKGPDCIDHALSPEDAYLDYEPPGSEVITVATGSGVTEQDKVDIIGGVWAHDIDTTDCFESAQDALCFIFNLTHNKLVREGNTVTIYKTDGETVWKKYDVSDDGRVEIIE